MNIPAINFPLSFYLRDRKRLKVIGFLSLYFQRGAVTSKISVEIVLKENNILESLYRQICFGNLKRFNFILISKLDYCSHYIFSDLFTFYLLYHTSLMVLLFELLLNFLNRRNDFENTMYNTKHDVKITMDSYKLFSKLWKEYCCIE